jgi:hypothetical protein
LGLRLIEFTGSSGNHPKKCQDKMIGSNAIHSFPERCGNEWVWVLFPGVLWLNETTNERD